MLYPAFTSEPRDRIGRRRLSKLETSSRAEDVLSPTSRLGVDFVRECLSVKRERAPNMTYRIFSAQHIFFSLCQCYINYSALLFLVIDILSKIVRAAVRRWIKPMPIEQRSGSFSFGLTLFLEAGIVFFFFLRVLVRASAQTFLQLTFVSFLFISAIKRS